METRTKILSRKALEWLRVVRAFASAHKARIYLASTILCIIFSFLSYRYYQNALICKYHSEKDCLEYGLNPQAKNIKTYVVLLLADCFILIFYFYSFLLKKTYRVLTAMGIAQHIFLFYSG